MLKILVVDDSKTLRYATAKMIERMGHLAIVASNGVEAIELFEQEKPGLVLLDVMMPDVDGYKVAKQIRTMSADEWVPIIFLSAKEDDQDLERGIEAGGDDYLVKPVSYVVLNSKIRAMQRINDMRQKLLYLSRELASANRELERISHQDGLTGIANRRYFDYFVNRELALARRTQADISLILCDVDFFKKFNDNYGHLSGDECLRKVATAIKGCCRRPTDLAARYGGEEFVMVLPNTNYAGAVLVAESMRVAVENLAIAHGFSQAAPVVTLSAGILACIPTDDTTVDAMITKADEALYQAKQTGRNRYIGFQSL
jgi:diguanylate cyclase (GGDEF)-like protein